tara:strand:- start:218 stop:610 length:393 start_codon:yes stop_codon:yes gene_type:complete
MIKTPKFPLVFNEDKGFLNNSELKGTIQFHLTNLFLTNPGEKISDGNYGIGMRRFLFEPGLQGVTQEIKSIMLSQIGAYMPYIRVDESSVFFLEEKNTLSISLKYTILETSEKDILTFEVATAEQTNLTY